MEEKKKRWRPSLTAYRALEKELEKLKSNMIDFSKIDIEEIVRDNTIYRQALINFSSMIRCKKEPALLVQGSEDCDFLIDVVYKDIKGRWNEDADKLYIENCTLTKSNKLLEDEIQRLRDRNSELQNHNAKLFKENRTLKNRSLWERIWNK